MPSRDLHTNGTGPPTRLTAADFGQCPLPITAHDTVQLGHGSGGSMTGDLVSNLFLWAFENPVLSKLDDSATLTIGEARIAFSTDSFIVDPIFFPGGDIGDLAVNGTVNDLAMSGARPLFLSLAFILEEGFPLEDLRRVVESVRLAADAAGVTIVTGDTKVLNRGKGDKIFINTTGIGVLEHDYELSSHGLQPGDRVLVSGGIAEHGMAILSRREGLQFETPIESDSAPLHGLVQRVLSAGGSGVRAMRDATRGGLAAVLNEFSVASAVGIRLEESRIPIKPPVAGACEFLGLDPMHVANEGKMVIAVAADLADVVLDAMQSDPLGKDASIIGVVTAEHPGMVAMRTRIGGSRIVDMLVGEQLPRIC